MATPSFDELLGSYLEGPARARMVAYAELLERWGARHNLVRWRDRDELVKRHLVESLAARPWLAGKGVLVDVGSGAGLPGIPLLVACSGWRGVLLEPRQKRWAFLRLVIRELGLDAVAVAARFAEYDPGEAAADAVTVRALTLTTPLLAWARGLLKPGGRVLVWTTEEGERALGDQAGWRVLSSALPSLEHGRLVSLEPCFT